MASTPIYPIGVQSFEKLIEGGYVYVDKTHHIAHLIKEGGYVFLSRPRRFGKSLLLSTIQAVFQGKRHLFEGLAIDAMDMEWTPVPVLYFDFNSGLYDTRDGLLNLLNEDLKRYENEYGLEAREDLDVALRFRNIIQAIYDKRKQKVVILVDEYDKPLLGLEENPKQLENNQTLLKAFYSNLKSMDACIKFAMVTGVARFSKVSIFSDLNNLNDISMYDQYQEICGWTEEELISNFQPGIRELAAKRHESPEATVEELRRYYDGYLFSDEGNRIYNPYSVLKAFFSKTIKPFWFESGTPTFLAKKIRKSGIDPRSLNGQTRSYSELIAVGQGTDSITTLMFQTGYLTIDSYDVLRQRYVLRFPNREVEIGFAQNLLPLFAPETKRSDSPFKLQNFQDDLYDGQPDAFMERLRALVKDLPGEDHKESTYRALTYLLCLLSGTNAQTERHSYKGRSDLEVTTPDFIYIFEFKYNKSLQDAIHQLHDRDYAGHYAADRRKLFLIAANFTEEKKSRGLEYRIL